MSAYVPHNYPLDKLEPGLNENAFYDPTNFTYPSGSYVCEVEVDPETGRTRVDRFTAVDDFGNIVNPMIVEGQVHGGLAQGLGQAMLEACVYDPESGQLLTGSYMDYTMPRADDLPSFTVDHTVTPCTHNPLGVKGCGEAGAIGSPPAFINALTDALGVRDIAMPATPERVWRVVNKVRLNRGGPTCTPSTTNVPSIVAATLAALQGDAHYLAGGQSLVQAMKLRLSTPARLVDLGGLADLKGIRVDAQRRHDRRDDDARRRGGLGRGAQGDPGAGRTGRRHRRPDGAQHGHDRRLDRQRRPRRLLSRRRCWALGATVRTNQRTIAADGFFTGLFETALEPGELITAVQFPDAEEGGLRQVQAAGLALRTGRRVRRARAPAACAWPSPAPKASVFREPALEAALTPKLHARGRQSGQGRRRRHQRRPAWLAGLPRRDDQRAWRRASLRLARSQPAALIR